MALINILAKSPKSIQWNEFLETYNTLSRVKLEIFPIPKELGFDYDSIGVSVHKGYANRDEVISELRNLVAFFGSAPYNLKFLELYEGVELTTENIESVVNKLLPLDG